MSGVGYRQVLADWRSWFPLTWHLKAVFCLLSPFLRTQRRHEELNWEGLGTNKAEIVKGKGEEELSTSESKEGGLWEELLTPYF